MSKLPHAIAASCLLTWLRVMALLIKDHPLSLLEAEKLDLGCTFVSGRHARCISIPISADVAGGSSASAASRSHLPSELRVQDLSSSIRICWYALVRSCADSCFRRIGGRSWRLYTLVRSEPGFNASVASSECAHRLISDSLHHVGDRLDDRTGDKSRFTAPIAEGYFGYVIKAGVRLLFFYLVLGIGVKIATQWNSALVAACVPTTTTLPWYATYGVAPTSIVTKVCSAPMNWPLLLNLVANSVILAIVTTVVPSTAAGIVSGTAGLALNQAFEAAFIARTIIQPISSMMQALGNKTVRALGGSDGSVEARFRANEGIQAPRAPADPPEARVGAAPSTAPSSDPNAGTQVLNSKLTRQMGAEGGIGGGSTRYIGGNGNGKATSSMPSGSRGTAKI